jgi:hypothetical protein
MRLLWVGIAWVLLTVREIYLGVVDWYEDSEPEDMIAAIIMLIALGGLLATIVFVRADR